MTYHIRDIERDLWFGGFGQRLAPTWTTADEAQALTHDQAERLRRGFSAQGLSVEVWGVEGETDARRVR